MYRQGVWLHACCLNFWTVERSMKSFLPLGMRQLILPSSSPAQAQVIAWQDQAAYKSYSMAQLLSVTI